MTKELAILLVLVSMLGCTGAVPVSEQLDAQKDISQPEIPEPTPEPTSAPIVYEKRTTNDSFLDKNGDGFQDTIIYKYKVSYDVDFDGKFDYTKSLRFKEYESEWHRDYIQSGYDKGVYENITMEGLDALCFESREKVKWVEENFMDYYFWHDGYSFLQIFSESEDNDINLLEPKIKGDYEYSVIFNPDGSIQSVSRGDDKVTLAGFDYETNTLDEGELVYLPSINAREDLEGIIAELDAILAGA